MKLCTADRLGEVATARLRRIVPTIHVKDLLEGSAGRYKPLSVNVFDLELVHELVEVEGRGFGFVLLAERGRRCFALYRSVAFGVYSPFLEVHRSMPLHNCLLLLNAMSLAAVHQLLHLQQLGFLFLKEHRRQRVFQQHVLLVGALSHDASQLQLVIGLG